MLERIGMKFGRINKSKLAIAGSGSGFKGFKCIGNAYDEVNNTNLKYMPKSEYIYNSELVTESNLQDLDEYRKNKLILELQEENRRVRCENEQFRQKNFSMYLKLRKLGVNEA